MATYFADSPGQLQGYILQGNQAFTNNRYRDIANAMAAQDAANRLTQMQDAQGRADYQQYFQNELANLSNEEASRRYLDSRRDRAFGERQALSDARYRDRYFNDYLLPQVSNKSSIADFNSAMQVASRGGMSPELRAALEADGMDHQKLKLLDQANATALRPLEENFNYFKDVEGLVGNAPSVSADLVSARDIKPAGVGFFGLNRWAGDDSAVQNNAGMLWRKYFREDMPSDPKDVSSRLVTQLENLERQSKSVKEQLIKRGLGVETEPGKFESKLSLEPWMIDRFSENRASRLKPVSGLNQGSDVVAASAEEAEAIARKSGLDTGSVFVWVLPDGTRKKARLK